MPHANPAPRRVAVVAADPVVRGELLTALGDVTGAHVVAWADDVEPLLALGTRMDICLCAAPPPRAGAARLRERGAALLVAPTGSDPVAALRAEVARESAPASRRPRLAPRQREVLVAYVAGSELLPTVARELGMDRETLKTHLRRIRTKYAEVGRPAPTRRDLYVRAVEDGLVPPPAEHGSAHDRGRG